ncbi:LON peptidase substrate-binding domain-containing protein [Portibacter marinus]|uniref:LON peptidase substrate-binding domain-containing protein n=1 Tax=Portibacter marinus TaxID=2898660 RepID=UPI001F27FD3F|nr:LON peptidase substrate-binding domain-containing protein [Portibacter marinus]
MNTALIPVFPLQLVIFPDEVINLHIFEPRYKQMMNEAEANGTHFGVPTYIDKEDLTYGTEARLKEVVKKYPDGKLDIRIQGVKVFKVENFIPRMNSRLYSGADITYLDIDRKKDISKNEKIIGLLANLYQYLKMHKPLPSSAEAFDSYRIGHYIGLALRDELKLLSIPKETDRQDFIIQHLENIIPVLREMNALEKKVQMNGHFRNIIPPNI